MANQHQRQHSRVKSVNSEASSVDNDQKNENELYTDDENDSASSTRSPKKRKVGSVSVS